MKKKYLVDSSILANRSLTVLGLAAVSLSANAQVNGTWTASGGGNWSTSTNWAGGLIPDAAGTATFNDASGQTANFTATIDTTSRTLSQIIYNSAWSHTVAASGGANLIIASGGLTLNSISSLRSSPTLFFTTGNTISSIISGTGDLTKTGVGNVSLTGANTFTGTVRVNQGSLYLNNGNTSLGNLANGVILDGGILGVNTATLTSARTFTIGTNGGRFQTFTTTTLTGTLTGTGLLSKEISGTMDIQGDGSTFTGALRVDSGVFQISGANGRIGAGLDVELNNSMTLTNATANRVNRLAGRGVVSRGGNLSFVGSAAATSSEALGTLTLNGGNSFISHTAGTGQNSTLSFASITRSNNGVALVRGTNLGVAPAPGQAVIQVGTAPTLIGGGGTTATNQSIIPFLYGNTSASGIGGSSFVSYDAVTQRLLVVDPTTQMSNDILTAATTDNVNQGVDATLTGPVTINALRMGALTATTISGGTINLTSGAILSSPTTATPHTINSNIDAGAQEIVANVTSGAFSISGLFLNGVLSGSGGFTKGGGGLVHMNGANNYTGSTNLVGGSTIIGSANISAGSNGPFGNSSTPINITGSTGSVRLYTSGNAVINRDLNVLLGSSISPAIGTVGASANESLIVNGNIQLNNPTNSRATGNFLSLEGGPVSSSAVTVNGVISGNGGLRSNFSGYNILNGANTYSGGTLLGGQGTILSGGTGVTAQSFGEIWEVGNNSAFGTGTVFIGSAFPSPTNSIPAIGTIVAGGGARTLSNEFLLVNGLARFEGTNPITLSGTVDLNGGAANNSWISVGTGTNLTVSGTVARGGLSKDGPGTLVLSGSNTYTGQTSIRNGVLSVSNIGNGGTAANLSAAPSGAGYLILSGNTVGTTGTLRYTGAGETTDRLFSLAGTGGTIDASGSGALVFGNTGNIAINTPPFNAGTSLTSTIGSAILPGIATLNTAGLVVGSTITSTNFPSGTTVTEVGSNFVRLSNVATASSAATTTFTLPTSFTTRPLNLTGSNTNLNTINSVIGNGSFAGLNVGVNKSGAGTWSLNGANTYTGGTTINGGTLLANDSGPFVATASATGVGNVTVNSGGTLGGNGSVRGNVTVNSGGVLSPGNSPGTLSVFGDLNLATGASLLSEVKAGVGPGSTANDLLVVSGTVNLNSANLVLDGGTYGPDPTDKFWIVNNTGSGAINGTFNGLAEGASVSWIVNSAVFTGFITYQGDFGTNSLTGGNDILIHSAVPEPGTFLVIGAGLAALARKRKKSNA